MKNAGPLAVFALVLAAVGGASYFLRALPEAPRDAGAELPGEAVQPAEEAAAASQLQPGSFASAPPAEPTGREYLTGSAIALPTALASTDATPPRGGPVEQRMLSGRALTQAASALTGSTGFDEQLRGLRSASNATALQREQDYAALVSENATRSLKGVSLRDIACGEVVCMAALDVQAGATGWRGWTTALQDNGTLPMPALTSGKYTAPDGSTQYRLIFTTNPAYNAILGGFAPSR